MTNVMHSLTTKGSAVIQIQSAEDAGHTRSAAELITELSAWDGAETGKLGFAAEEVAAFYYHDPQAALLHLMPPAGRLLLASVDGKLAGCIGYRRLERETCEMKHLYVRPQFRGLGLGRVLAKALETDALATGYRMMRLETVQFMIGAISLYESLGFERCPPYYEIPTQFLPITVFMEKKLSPSEDC